MFLVVRCWFPRGQNDARDARDDDRDRDRDGDGDGDGRLNEGPSSSLSFQSSSSSSSSSSPSSSAKAVRVSTREDETARREDFADGLLFRVKGDLNDEDGTEED